MTANARRITELETDKAELRTRILDLTDRFADLIDERDLALHRVAELEGGWARFIHRRVLVNTTDGAALLGTLVEASGPLLVLRGVEVAADVGGKALASPQKLDGEAIIDLTRVAWVQAPPADV